MWERKAQPRPDQAARAAVGALVKLAALEGWEATEVTEGVLRALEIARTLSNQDLRSEVVVCMLDLLDKELSSGCHDRPGITFNLLSALVDLPANQRPDRLGSLLDRAEALYGSEAFQLESALELRIALAPPEELTALRMRQAELWRERAESAEGILKPTLRSSASTVDRLQLDA